jgi:hypothetical protein
MPNATVKISLSDASLTTQEQVVPVIEAEVDNFSKFMAAQADPRYAGPLNNMERMLIKSYLVQKVRGKF